MRLYSRRLLRGFGLLEVILVFALVIGAAAIVFTVYQSTRPSEEANRATASLTVLAANIKGAYASGGNYSGISGNLLIKSGLVPKELIAASGTELQGIWSLPITVSPDASARHFVITYEGIPADVCAKMILGAAPYFEDVTVGDPGLLIRTNNGPIQANDVVTACGANPISVASFGSH